jgi:hypothetical protein
MKTTAYYVRILDDILRYMTSASNVIEEFGPKQVCSKNPEKQKVIDAIHHIKCENASYRLRVQELIDYILKDEPETDDKGNSISPNYGLANLQETLDNLKRILDKHDSLRSITLSVHAFVDDRLKINLDKKMYENETELTMSFDDLIYATHGTVFFGGDLAKIAFAARRILYMKYGDFVDLGEYKIIETEKFIVSIIIYSHRFEHKNSIEDQHLDEVQYTGFKIVQK